MRVRYKEQIGEMEVEVEVEFTQALSGEDLEAISEFMKYVLDRMTERREEKPRAKNNNRPSGD